MLGTSRQMHIGPLCVNMMNFAARIENEKLRIKNEKLCIENEFF